MPRKRRFATNQSPSEDPKVHREPGEIHRHAQRCARRMNRIAFAILIFALLAFIAFHFLPLVVIYDVGPGGSEESEVITGWQMWPDAWENAKSAGAGSSDIAADMISNAALACGTLLIIAAPFLIPILRVSRLTWWIVVLMSGLAAMGLSGITVFYFGLPQPADGALIGAGFYLLVTAQILNFIGLLFVRREIVPAPSMDVGKDGLAS